jgi:hypothetical protein
MNLAHGAALLAVIALGPAACGDKQDAAPAAAEPSPAATDEATAPEEATASGQPRAAAPAVPIVSPTAATAAAAALPAGTDRVVPAPFSPEVVTPAMKHIGEIVDGVRWRDANGDNVVIFSIELRRSKTQWGDQLESARLYANHYLRDGDEIRLLRTIRDRVDECEFDLFASFRDDALGVTDLDGDGVGEVTFAYELACMSDVSPKTLKLLLLEGGDKYIIRGETRVEVDFLDEVYGGDRTIDRSLTAGPKVFLDHATRTWDAIVGAR